jgi:hypothetical protein
MHSLKMRRDGGIFCATMNDMNILNARFYFAYYFPMPLAEEGTRRT